MSMEGCTHGSTAGFHLQTRDTDWGWRGIREWRGIGGWGECKMTRRERKGGEVVYRSAGVERQSDGRWRGEGCMAVYPVTG